jgi:ribonuclease HI
MTHVYVDGSFLPSTPLGGAAVYFHEQSPYNVETYVPNVISAFDAEVYASVMATRQALEMGISRLIIHQDCKQAIEFLQKIDYRRKCTALTNTLTEQFWKCSQYIEVILVHVKAHVSIAPAKESEAYQHWFGNQQADIMAKRASQFSRYNDARLRMERQNPLLCYSWSPGLILRIEAWLHIEHLYLVVNKIESLTSSAQRQQAIDLLVKQESALFQKIWNVGDLRIRLISIHDPLRPLFGILDG